MADLGLNGRTPHLVSALNEEEQELWRQLRRKRDFEGRVAEKRAHLQDLQDRRLKLSCTHAEASSSVDHLSTELIFAHEQQKEIEHDIAVLAESNRILQQAFAQQQASYMPSGMRGAEPSAVLAEEARQREQVEVQHQEIAHLRVHLEKLQKEKATLQHRQQVLFEKQRSAEQDRNRLLGTLQDDRSAINEVRQERIRLWEERSRTEREMAQLVRDAQHAEGASKENIQKVGGGQGPSTSASISAGIRSRVSQDTPQAFADSVKLAPRKDESPVRAHWTSFGDAASNTGGALGPPGGGVFPGGSSGGGMGPGSVPPPSFGDLAALAARSAEDGSSTGGGVTEWAGKLRDYRTSGTAGRHL